MSTEKEEKIVEESVEVEGFSEGTKIEIYLRGKKIKEWVVKE